MRSKRRSSYNFRIQDARGTLTSNNERDHRLAIFPSHGRCNQETDAPTKVQLFFNREDNGVDKGRGSRARARDAINQRLVRMLVACLCGALRVTHVKSVSRIVAFAIQRSRPSRRPFAEKSSNSHCEIPGNWQEQREPFLRSLKKSQERAYNLRSEDRERLASTRDQR